MSARLKLWVALFATAISQFVCNILFAGSWWVITGRGVMPNPDETLSSRVGRGAVKGKAWALLAESAIDAWFGAGHCRDAIGH